jgi:hypothetical protein
MTTIVLFINTQQSLSRIISRPSPAGVICLDYADEPSLEEVAMTERKEIAIVEVVSRAPGTYASLLG